jgi:hypothetical protein
MGQRYGFIYVQALAKLDYYLGIQLDDEIAAAMPDYRASLYGLQKLLRRRTRRGG